VNDAQIVYVRLCEWVDDGLFLEHSSMGHPDFY
jgi:hypothetical protein